MVVMVGCGKQASARVPSSATAEAVETADDDASRQLRAVDTHEYFPLDLGHTWTLYNEAYPQRITTIRVVRDSDGALALDFTKNHPDTYHGWGNNRLVWRVSDRGDALYAENELGTDDSGTEFGPYPDDQRFDQASGRWLLSVWFIGPPPAQIILPWSVRDGQRVSTSQQYGILRADGGRGYAHQQWNVEWRFVGDRLLLRFNEYSEESGIWIYEDWYLERGIGIVEISQWYDEARTSLTRRVVSHERRGS